MSCHREDAVIIQTPLDHHVDLEWGKTGRGGGVDAGEDIETGKSTSFMALKTASSSASRLTVTRSRPAALSRAAMRVSSTRSSWGELHVLNVREHGDQVLHAASQKRLATGDAYLADAVLYKLRATRSISSKLSNSFLPRKG